MANDIIAELEHEQLVPAWAIAANSQQSIW
jgi:hypothetical protein